MSKYDPLWAYIKAQDCDSLTLTFDDVARITGVPLDHSFLTYKKELIPYGFQVGKISMKGQTVAFLRRKDREGTA